MRIRLNEEFGEYMITRNSLAAFYEEKIENNKDDEIILDFKNIKFISRSCAAEYMKLREKSSKNVSEANMSIEVKKMFKVIVNQLKNSDFKLSKPSIIASN